MHPGSELTIVNLEDNMGYQIDIDVNSDQLEQINDALNTTFSSFRNTIEKLDRTIESNSRIRAAVESRVPNYEATKRTVAAESIIIKEFEKSGSFKFLSETLLTVARSLDAVNKIAKETSPQPYNESIKNLGNISQTIGRDSVATKEPKYVASGSVGFEGEAYLSEELQKLVRYRNKAIGLFSKALDTMPELDTPKFQEYKKEVQSLGAEFKKNVTALNSSVKVYKETGNNELLLKAIKQSDTSLIEDKYKSITNKSIPLGESAYRSETELTNYLKNYAKKVVIESVSQQLETEPIEIIAAPRRREKPTALEGEAAEKKTVSGLDRRGVPFLDSGTIKGLLSETTKKETNSTTNSTNSNSVNISPLTIDLESIIAEPFAGLEEEVNSLAKSIAKTRSVLDLPVVERTGVDEFTLKSGALQLEAYKRAMALNPSLPDRMAVLDSKSISPQDLYLKQEIGRIRPRIPVESQEPSFNQTVESLPKISPEKVRKDDLFFISDIEDIDITSPIQEFEDEIEYLAQIIVKTRKLIELTVLTDAGAGRYKLVSNPLPVQAYQRAMEIDPSLNNRIPALYSKRENIEENQNQQRILNPDPTPQVVNRAVPQVVEQVKKEIEVPEQLNNPPVNTDQIEQPKEEIQSFYAQMDTRAKEIENIVDSIFVEVKGITNKVVESPVTRRVPEGIKNTLSNILNKAKSRNKDTLDELSIERGSEIVYYPGGELAPTSQRNLEKANLNQNLERLNEIFPELVSPNTQLNPQSGIISQLKNPIKKEIQDLPQQTTPVERLEVEKVLISNEDSILSQINMLVPENTAPLSPAVADFERAVNLFEEILVTLDPKPAIIEEKPTDNAPKLESLVNNQQILLRGLLTNIEKNDPVEANTPSNFNPYRPPVPSSHNPYGPVKPSSDNFNQGVRSWLENGELRNEAGGGGGKPPRPPRKPPTPSGGDDDDLPQKDRSESELFRIARERQAAIKDRILQEGVGNIGSYRVKKEDLFPDQQPKNDEKAQLLVNTINRWIEKRIQIFENAALSDAKIAAKLGDNRIESLKSDNPVQARKILLAQERAETDQIKRDAKPIADAKKEESDSFNAYRRQLEARLKAALSDTTSNQEQLIKTAIEQVKKTKEYLENNSSQFFDEERFGKGGVEIARLQQLENQGTKKLESVRNKTTKDDVIQTTNLQEMRAGMASIKTFIQDLQAFTTGLIQVSSAINKEVIKLGVANNNSIAKTQKDIADSSEIAKRFGGSTASYLKDFADIKIADLSQVSQSGALTPNRFLDSEVKSLVTGLRSAYNVNQLDKEAQDGASKAVVQMVSKGKIQAEELRGQLGDRLNGAVTLFAQSLGISTAQLDRRLKEGSVMDIEVFKFGRLLEKMYAEAAQLPTLIKETTNLSGSASDIATQAAQPVAGVVTVAAQFLNSITDGIKANAATMSIAMIPVGVALVGGISTGVKSAFLTSSFSSPIAAGLGEALRNNMKTMMTVGGGLGVAAIGSSLFGSTGLDKTILKLGDQLKNLVGLIGGALGTAQEKGQKSGIGQSSLGKIAFEVLPLAALLSPVTNYAIDATKNFAEETKKKNAEIANKNTEAGNQRKPNIGERLGNAFSSLPLLNIGASIAAGVVAYSIANTRFISEYSEATDRMIRELRKSKKDESTTDKKVENFRKNEGTENPLSIDSAILGVQDIINAAKGDYKEISVAGLQDMIEGSSKERAAELKKILDEKVKVGYAPKDGNFAGAAANNQIIKENAAIDTLTKQLSERMNPAYYAEEVAKGTPIVANYRIESQRLLEMQNNGTSRQVEIDAQAVKVQTLAVQAREAIPDMLNAQADVTSRIAKLEETKQAILTQELAGSKDRAAAIDAQISMYRAMLPKFLYMIQSLSDPNQAISDRKLEISAREKKIGLERIKDSSDLAQERNLSTQTRFSESNDEKVNLRESSLAVKSSQLNLTKLQEQLQLATERKELISRQTSSDTQQTEYEAALKAEAEALNAVNEGMLAVTKARLDERQAMEDSILNNYNRAVRNYSADNKNTDNFEAKKGLQRGILDQTFEFGTLSKSQFALSEYNKVLPSLTLSAGEARERLRELSDQVALSTLSFLEQQNQFTTAREVAQIDSTKPTEINRDTYFDREAGLRRNLQKSQIDEASTKYLIDQTRNALNSVKDPEQKANLALKLINLETDAIRKKHDVEMAQIELARAAYKRTMEVFTTRLNQNAETGQSRSQNRQFVEGRRLEEALGQTNAYGATITENRQALDRLNSAIAIQTQNRSSNQQLQRQSETLFNELTPGVSSDYKRFLSNRLQASSAFQINTDKRDLQTQIDLANNSGDRTSTIKTQNLGEVSVDVAEALVKLLDSIAQLKQIEQSNSEAVAQARIAYNLSTAAVTRGRRQQDSNNRLSKIDTDNEEENNRSLIRTTITNAGNQAEAIKLRNAGLNQPLSSIIRGTQTDYLEQIRRAEAAIKSAEAARAALKRTQDEMAFGATQIELDANNAILRGEDEKIRKLRVQLRGVQISGAERLIGTIASFTSDVSNLFENASAKLRESVDLLNRNRAIFRGQGADYLKEAAIYDTVPTAYTDGNGVVRQRDDMSKVSYDPNVQGNYETAQLITEMNKVQAEARTRIALLEYVQNNLPKIREGGVEETQQYKDVPELRGTLKEIEALVSGSKDLTEATNTLNVAMANLKDTLISDDERAVILNRKVTRDRNNDIIAKSELESSTLQTQERQIAGRRGMTDMWRLFLGTEPLVEEIEAQRRKATAEFGNSQLAPTSAERERGQVVYNNRIIELDDQLSKLPSYGNRLVQAIEEAVASGSRLSAVLSDAISKGDWSMVLNDVLVGIANSIGDKFANDAAKGLGGLVAGGVQSLFGIPSKSSGDLPSYNQGTLPSYNSGLLPDGVAGKKGADYPRTRSQDPREMSTSHLAIIGRDELVVPSHEVSAYIEFSRGIKASSNVDNSTSANTANTVNNSYNYSNYQGGSNDTFKRPEVYKKIEENARMNRFQ